MITNISYLLNSFTNIVKRSFFDKTLYQDIYSSWQGKGIKYFLTLIFATSIPYILIMLVVTNIFTNVFNNVISISENNIVNDNSFEYEVASIINEIIEKFPEIEIKHGSFQTAKPGVVHIKDRNKEVLININTAKKHDIEEHFPISIYSDALVIMGTPHFIIEDLEDNKIMKINYETIISGVKKVLENIPSKIYIFLIIIVANMVFTGFIRIFINFLSITIGCHLLRIPIMLPQALRLSAISLSPAYAIDFFIHLFSLISIMISKNLLILVFLITQETTLITMISIAYSIIAIHWVKRFFIPIKGVD